MENEQKTFEVNGKKCVLYKAQSGDRPLVVLNNYADDGGAVCEAVHQATSIDFNFLNISGLNWGCDMTPWPCPPLFKGDDTVYSGGADEYLKLLASEIVPGAKDLVNGFPTAICLAGYSLGGLFALYAMQNCDVFDGIASVSGSLWYPDFVSYVRAGVGKRIPDKLYISLGDAEAGTKNKVLRTVQDNTQELVSIYRDRGYDVTWELNEGNHFREPERRTARGIVHLLESISRIG